MKSQKPVCNYILRRLKHLKMIERDCLKYSKCGDTRFKDIAWELADIREEITFKLKEVKYEKRN